MKVIFLDIDGVLNCKKTPNPRKFPYVVDRKLLRRLKRLLDRTGAKAVLSSTWRYDPAGLFSAHPRVTRYAIIDDEDDGLDTLPLFQPQASTGITPDIVKGVADYLAGKTDHDMRRNAVVRVIQNVGAALRSHPG
jgi:hypothetical protein